MNLIELNVLRVNVKMQPIYSLTSDEIRNRFLIKRMATLEHSER